MSRRKNRPARTNGTHVATPPATANPPAKPPEEMSLLESQEKEKRLLESLAWGPVSDGFYGSDLYFDLFQDRYGTPGQGFFVPISILSDRKGGGNWPLWRNEFELAQYRQRSRIICRKNSYARSLLFNLQTHIIGKGFTYEIQAKEERDAAPEPGVQPNPQDDELVTRTQKFVDQFLMANRFTASVNPDPDSSLVTSSREWETARRMYRDGEGILRLFHCEDDNFRGMTFVRFVEPEQVTDPPQAGADQGWSYGMRHAVEPFEDEEDIKEYYVKYKDTSGRHEEGELVPASEIVHLKNLEEDAATKRGLPAFSLDMVDALERASKLMRNVSTSSGVRAATAEIWQHENSSEAQVQSMATRMAERQFTNPITGRTETQERTRPGSTRRIPAGQKPVWPQAVGASEHLEVLQGDLRQAGIVFAAPEYMTGDASNNNMASSKEAGAPFVIGSEVTQNHFKTAFIIIVLKAIKWAVKCGILPENTLDIVELQVTAPTISVRDPLQTAQEDQILIGAKIKSVKTCQSERGLDPDHEAANNEEFDAKFGQQGGALPMPGDDNLFGGGGPDNGPPAGPQSGGGGQPPLANFSLESAELLEAGDSLPPSFTGEHDDSLGRKRYYSQGKLVKGPEDVATAQKQQGGNKATAPAQIHGAGIDPANVTKEDVNRRIADLSNKPMHPSQVPNEVMTSGKWFKAMAASGDAYQRANAETLFGTTLKKAEESGVKIEQLFGKDHPQLAQFKRMIDLAPTSQGSGFDSRTQGGERTPGYQHNPAGVTKAQEEAAKVRKLMGLESRDVLENFTGVDAHGHHWQDGKQIAAPKDSPSSPDKHVETWANYASKIPAKAYAAAKAKVKGHYDKLTERYGRGTAIAIMGAGIAGLPIPLPGSSLITAAPVVAVAELVRYLRSSSNPVVESAEAWLFEAWIAGNDAAESVAKKQPEPEPETLRKLSAADRYQKISYQQIRGRLERIIDGGQS